MNKYLLGILTILIHICVGCGSCGKDVNLGRFKLLNQSIEEWHPYVGVSELAFRSSEGEIITMQVEERNRDMINWVVRDICWKSSMDNAQEYFLGESLHAEYQCTLNEISYSFTVMLAVVQMYSEDNYDELRLVDKATFGYDVTHDNGYLAGRIYTFVVDYRGNANLGESAYENPDYANEIEINGVSYSEVWYFTENGVPTLYIQKGKGIIAFVGQNGKVWNII